MIFANFPNGVSSYGIPMVGGTVPTNAGTYLFVNGAAGSDGNDGRSIDAAFATVQKAVDTAAAALTGNCTILIAPGSYDEGVAISREPGLFNLTLFGLGGRGAASIAPSAADTIAVANDADDLTIVNVGLDGSGIGAGLVNSGARLRVYSSKLEGDDIALQLVPGTVTEIGDGTKGDSSDVLLRDCETGWAATGVLLIGSDYGAVTQACFDRCRHHNHASASFAEAVGTGGSADVLFRNLEIRNAMFDNQEDGSAPAAFLALAADSANSGIVTQCAFPTAIDGGLNLVSPALIWCANYHIGGISTGQPS